ncbi:hypothetical protein [Actinomadura sp. HBU206391]|uniref:hypothetical protein n=1 Tax=Actinomadura sp. HBU206391 TaxID=2731692 RepID=UPI00164FA4C4|nr:hypothetical protein [Actinomadura sp. HBU206391]MBC6458075.1 hypothetical protein [Actinomadura sp. HBU206391]
MHKLTDYLLAIRTPNSPSAPAGVKTVELVPADGDDVISSTIGGLRAGGLTAADFRSRAIFLVPDGPGGLVTYAALCGFSGRRVDAYADGAVLEFSRLDRDGAACPDAGRPSEFLMWAQVGGPVAEGIPTVHLGSGGQELVSPQAATVIRYAARLRMVPPESVRDALAMFVLVAALRRRADDRFPFLSTGTEPVPLTKNALDQGIDLEKLRQEAARHRQELRIASRGAEVVARVPVSPHNRRIAEANGVDIRTVLRRLGSTTDEEGMWHCPRPRSHSNGDERPSMKVYGDNRTRCQRCDAEKIGPVRLAVDVLRVTPDEAASFILDSDRVVDLRAA